MFKPHSHHICICTKFLLTICAVIVTLLPVTLGAPELARAASAKRLLAYYAYWNESYRADQIPYSKLSHIAHAFVTPEADGTLTAPEGYLESALLTNAHNAGVKVLASVGGASESANFPTIAASAELRTAFANNIEAFLRANEYDGVDIDWEFPENATDRANLNLLIQALRDKFDASPQPAPTWLITMAVSPGDYYGQWLDYDTLNDSVDFYNLMTYDFHGSWFRHSGHNAPLLRGNDPKPDGSVVEALDYMLDARDVPPSQINVGIAFYGYNFYNSEKLYDRCQRDCSTTYMGYNEIVPLRGNGWTQYWDGASKVPYLRKDNGRGMLTFDNPRSVRNKVFYALSTRGVGGVFMWELSQDKMPNGNQPLLNVMFNASGNP